MPLAHRLALAWMVGCAPEPPPLPPAEPQAPAPAALWRLAGVVSDDPTQGIDHPHFEGGADTLGEDCKVARASLRSRPPPCVAELWRPVAPSPQQGDAVLVRVGDQTRLRILGQDLDHDARWSLMGGTLGPCVSDPLALPPAGDAAGLRVLERLDGAYGWVLRFSGQNPCHLSGDLRLPIQGQRVDASGLSVDGTPWTEGGAQLAQERRLTWHRLLVRERWNELTPEDKILSIKALSEDPSSEADALLRAIIDRDPNADADARRALERRSQASAPEPP